MTVLENIVSMLSLHEMLDGFLKKVALNLIKKTTLGEPQPTLGVALVLKLD